MRGEIELEPFVTHTMPLERINEAFDLMHEGKSIRTVIHTESLSARDCDAPDMERIEHHACFGGWQDVCSTPRRCSAATMSFAVYLPPQAAHARVPGAVLAVGPDLHRAELHHQGRRAALRGRARRDPGRAGHQPARRRRRRRRRLRPGPGRRLLPQCHASSRGPRTTACTTTWSTNCRRWSRRTSRPPTARAHQRPLDGRPRRAGDRAEATPAATAACRRSRRSSRRRRCRGAQKAFAAYLGEDRDAWRAWDATALVATRRRAPAAAGRPGRCRRVPGRASCGRELLQAACAAAGHPLTLRLQPGYDHSYYFIASFIGEHIAHHARALAS